MRTISLRFTFSTKSFKVWLTHDLSDGGVPAGRSRGEAVEDDGVAGLEGGAHEIDEDESWDADKTSRNHFEFTDILIIKFYGMIRSRMTRPSFPG